MFSPGEVVRFRNIELKKIKFHLCVHRDGRYFYMNSPKQNAYAGDFKVEIEDVPFLPPREFSIISCNRLLKYPQAELTRLGAETIGCLPNHVLRNLFKFVEEIEFLTDEERLLVLEGLDDWS